MIKNITYEDKISIQNDDSVARKNKVTDDDMNEIKEVVNANADEQTTQNTDISNIKKEQETQNTNIEENNSKIVELQTEKAKLETELKEMQEDFYQNSIRGQARGEYIHVEDSSNCRAKIGIGGNSEQEVVTDNLFNNTWKQGIIASETGVEIDSTENIRSSSVEVHASHLYSISRSIYTSYMSFRFYTKDGTYLGNQSTEGIMTTSNTDKRMNANESSMTFTITNANVAKMRIVDNSNNLTTKYTLTTDTINPDYPSEIKTVGSNVNILIPKKYNNQTINGVTLNSNVDGSITLNGTMEEAGTIGIVDTTFSISKDSYGFSIGETKLNSFNIFMQKTDYTNIILLEIGRTTAQVIKELDAMSIKSVNMYINKGTVFNNYVIKPKLEKKRVTTYSPYSMGSVKVTKCNENILDEIYQENSTVNGVEFKQNGNEVTLNGTATSEINFTIKLWNSANGGFPFETGTYSILGGLNGSVRLRIFRVKDNGNPLVDTGKGSNGKLEKGEDYRFWLTINNGTVCNNLKLKLMLAHGIVTEYTEHQEQSYIMPVQQEMLEGDYFDWDNEEEVHTWNKLVLDGTENWEYDSTYNYFKCPSYVFEQIPSTASGDGGKQLSNYFSVVGNWNTFKNNTNLNGFNPVSNLGYKLIIRNTNCRTIDTFKAWLKSQYDAGTPVTIYYKLATPTRLPFTDEQKAVAKELNNARTYKNVTNITTDSIAIIDLDYAKDLETLLTSKESEV